MKKAAIHRMLAAFAAILIFTGPAKAATLDLTGNWEARVMGAAVTAEFAQDGQMFTGVMRIPEPGGKVNVYHLAGAIFDEKFVALHGSGHVFEGRMTSPDTAEGVFKLAEGGSLSVRFVRKGLASAAGKP